MSPVIADPERPGRLSLKELWHWLRGCGPFKPVWDGSGKTSVWACAKCGELHSRTHHGGHRA